MSNHLKGRDILLYIIIGNDKLAEAPATRLNTIPQNELDEHTKESCQSSCQSKIMVPLSVHKKVLDFKTGITNQVCVEPHPDQIGPVI